MMPIIHPWTEYQESNDKLDDLFAWKWKDNTPEEIKQQYRKWEEYCNKTMKL